MTMGVNQVPTQPLPDKPGAEKQSTRNNHGASSDFSEVLRIARTGKPGPVNGQDESKPAVDVKRGWPHFDTRLDGRGSPSESPAPPWQAPLDTENAQGHELEIRNRNRSPDDRQTPPADTDRIRFDNPATPAPTFPFPPILVRRLTGKEDAETPVPGQPADTIGRIANPAVAEMNGGKPAGTQPAQATAAESFWVGAGAVQSSAEEAQGSHLFGRAGETIAVEAAADPAGSAEQKRHADAPKIAARVNVLSDQAFPAPMSATATLLTEAIAADGTFLPGPVKPALEAVQGQAVALPAHSLKIELHPAELGMVTASLRVIGEQLSIELKVDTQEAHRRLSADSEQIVKSLRGLGYEIDSVTVLQPQIAVGASTKVDAGASVSGQAMRGELFGSGAAGGDGAGSGGQRAGAEGGDARRQAQKSELTQSNRSNSGVYI